MPKGHKRVKGVPELHNQLKTKATLSLTPTGIAGLDSLAGERNISRSELVDRIGRREILLMDSREQPIPEVSFELSIPPKSLPFSQRDKLPNCPAAYIVINRLGQFTDGQCFRLHERFHHKPYLIHLRTYVFCQLEDVPKKWDDQYLEGFGDDFEIIWIESSDTQQRHRIHKRLKEKFEELLIDRAFRSWSKKYSEI